MLVLRIIVLTIFLGILPTQFCFAENWPVRFQSIEDCPFSCIDRRPGFISEVLELAFEEINAGFYLSAQVRKSKVFQKALDAGLVDLTYSFHKQNTKKYLYSGPIGSLDFCAYGKVKKEFSYENLTKMRVVYKNYDFYALLYPKLGEMIKQNKYYLDQFEVDTSNHYLFSLVAEKKYEWLLSFSSSFLFYIEGKGNIYEGVHSAGCLGKANLYLAIDKAYLRSWELKNALDKFLEKFLESHDYRSLLKYYRIKSVKN